MSPARRTGAAASREGLEIPRLEGRELSLDEIRADPLDFLERATREHPDLFRYDAGGWTTVVLNRPEWVWHVLQAGPERYSKLATPDLMMLQPMLGGGLMTSEGASWHRQRRVAQPAFAHEEIVGFVDLMDEAAEQALARWSQVAGSSEAIDLEVELSRLTIQVVARCLFGIDLSDDGADVGAAIACMNDYMAYYQPGDSARQEEFDEATRTVHRIVHRILLERRLLGGGGKDLLARLTAAASEGGPMPSLRDQIFTYLMAGHETTAKALVWTLFLLDAHRGALDRLRGEVDRVVGDGPVLAGHIEDLTYARMVIHEAMRLYPPVWLMSRRCLRGDEVDECRIPAGALVVVSPYTLHRHPRYWPDPLAFDPERFDPHGAWSRDHTYLPFSGGPRRCIGRAFATVETVVVLAAIVRRYDLRLVPGHRVRPEALVTLRPSGGMPMTVTARRAAG